MDFTGRQIQTSRKIKRGNPMKFSNTFVLAILFLSVLMFVEPALAAPGGKIISAAFNSFWGRIGLSILAIIFLPLIIWVWIKEKMAEKRSRADLDFMLCRSSNQSSNQSCNSSSNFNWLKIQQRVQDCFYRVHSGWESEDLSAVSGWMTDWYWQNQQLVHLQKWKQQGLVNICDIKKITNIKPILFVHRNSGQEHEDSTIVISIRSNMQDYLQNRETKKIVEGSKSYKDVEMIWSFTMESGIWKLSDIEEGRMSIAYANLIKQLPDIESTLAGDLCV